jgi:hypothetical protein
MPPAFCRWGLARVGVSYRCRAIEDALINDALINDAQVNDALVNDARSG